MDSVSSDVRYFSKDFDWEQLRQEIESDPSHRHHLVDSEPSLSSAPPSQDSQAWNRFHNRHSTGKFFKERRYLLKEFPELLSSPNARVLEVGCGNGSTALAILRGQETITVYACDCSEEALERAMDMIKAAKLETVQDRFHTFVCDFSVAAFPNWIFCDFCRENFPQQCQGIDEAGMPLSDASMLINQSLCVGGMDFVTLIFTLSAVPLHRMLTAIKECLSILKPGGLLLFRDYGLYDMTMIRFDQSQKVGPREYMRSDGTRSYFYCLDTVKRLFTDAGFKELELEYCCVKSVNRRKGEILRRVWVHGKFQKPTDIVNAE